MKKRTLALLLLALTFSLTACGKSENETSQEQAKEQVKEQSKLESVANAIKNKIKPEETESKIYFDLEEELSDAKKVKLTLPKNAEVLNDFASSMERMRDEGLDFLGFGMTRQASYCFSYVGGSVSAVRLAAEQILGEEPTGFGDWDTIGAVSFATPVPYLCEAVAADFSGNTERAEECKARAELNPNQVAEYAVFAALADMDQKTLKNLTEALIEFENHIYWFYPADPIPRERNGMEWSPEFHLVLAAAFEEETALFGQQAV